MHADDITGFDPRGLARVKTWMDNHVRDGRLADLAPTLLDLMGLPQPEEMTGQSLIGT